MMNFFISLIIAIFCILNTSAQDISIETFTKFATRLNPQSDTVYVINFWATWCKPCVEELPEFQKLQDNYSNSNLKITLANLDYKSQYTKSLVPFVKKHQLTSEVILLNAPDYNNWLPKVNKNWSGAIPATIIIHKASGTRLFFERQMSYDELVEIIKPLVN
jgi:thiol-disulfide isomerase/thioredoxin